MRRFRTIAVWSAIIALVWLVEFAILRLRWPNG